MNAILWLATIYSVVDSAVVNKLAATSLHFQSVCNEDLDKDLNVWLVDLH